MRWLNKRTIIGIVCIVLAFVICFVVTPLFDSVMKEQTVVLRVSRSIAKGERISAAMLETVSVGKYNLPSDIISDKDAVIGRYAAVDMTRGDYIMHDKLSVSPLNGNSYLYDIEHGKYAVSVSLKSFAGGLSGKLEQGDIISIISQVKTAGNADGEAETFVYPELQYLLVLGVTTSSGIDTETAGYQNGDSSKDLPSSVTVMVDKEQARLLAKLELDGKIHIALVYRGSNYVCEQYLKYQSDVLEKLYPDSDIPEIVREEPTKAGDVDDYEIYENVR